MIERRPTLLHSCASAATAREARFRVDYPNSKSRVSRVIALDAGADALLHAITNEPWRVAHLLTFVGPIESDRGEPDAQLRSLDGFETRLSDELVGADVAIMIATDDTGADGASIVGRACASRRIMTAGLVVPGEEDPGDAVNALRPYAAVLVVSADEGFVPEMLGALRA